MGQNRKRWGCCHIDHSNVFVNLATSVPKHFDCLVLNVGLGHNNQLKLVGVYRPSRLLHVLLTIYLNRYLSMVNMNYSFWEILILSDTLKYICSELNLSQQITEPTQPNPKAVSVDN